MKNTIITIAIILAASTMAKSQTPDTAFIAAHLINAAKIDHFKNDQFDTDSVTHVGFVTVCSDGLTYIDANIILCSDNATSLKNVPIHVTGSAFTTLKASFQAAGNFYPILTYFSNNYLTVPTKLIVFK